MKRKIEIVLCLVTLIGLMAACKKGAVNMYSGEIVSFDGFENTEYNKETDHQYYFLGESHIAAAADGYYIIGLNNLCYMDRDDMKALPVCSRTDCSHSALSECDANIDSISSLCYYKGYLYYLESVTDGTKDDETLYRRSLDGSVREKVCELVSGNKFMMSEICIHRGYLYYSVPNNDDNCTLYRLNLDNHKQEIIFKCKGFDADLYRFIGYGDGILFLAGYASDKKCTEYNFELYYYDAANNNVELVMDDFSSNYTVVEDRIYYPGEGGIHCFDTEGGEDTLFYETDELIFLSYDGRYLYLDNHYMISNELIKESDSRIYVVDLDGKLIDTIDPKGNLAFYGDEYYLFVNSMNGVMYFDKSKFGTGENKGVNIAIQ